MPVPLSHGITHKNFKLLVTRWHFSDGWRILAKELKGKSMVQVDQNLVDLVWSKYGKPDEPTSQLLALGDHFSGKLFKCLHKFSQIFSASF